MSDDQMLKEHQKSWHDFIKLTIYSIIGIVVALVLMGVFLTPLLSA